MSPRNLLVLALALTGSMSAAADFCYGGESNQIRCEIRENNGSVYQQASAYVDGDRSDLSSASTETAELSIVNERDIQTGTRSLEVSISENDYGRPAGPVLRKLVNYDIPETCSAQVELLRYQGQGRDFQGNASEYEVICTLSHVIED